MTVRLSALVLLCLAATACTSPATIPVVAEAPVAAVPLDVDPLPIEFRRIVVRLKRGEDIGVVRSGPLCLPYDDLYYRGGRVDITDAELATVFHDEMSAASFHVVGDPDALFDDPDDDRARYVVAGLVSTIRANVCYPALYFDTAKAKGEAFMEVDWQIFSRLDRRIVLELTTRGQGAVARSRGGGDVELLLLAFAQATRNLVADAAFRDLVLRPAPVVTAAPPTTALRAGAPTTAAPTGPSVFFTARPPFTEPLGNHPEDARQATVTVFAGDGHGSGVFIGDRGQVLTNFHVVGGAELVKLRFADGGEVLARVIARDPRRDVALLVADAAAPPGLPVVADLPTVGSDVFAVGTPVDAEFATTVSRGIVSALRDRDDMPFIQSDANIQPGSSGGPLLDANGNLIGLAVSVIIAPGGTPANLNNFIPIADALRVLNLAPRPPNPPAG